jgi:redox-sensitive bicupin YhaK (pirin superfamily)
VIQAGAVNLMTAGRGIVHSERAGDDLAVTSRLHGIQSWIALPLELEETEPGFIHYPASALPEIDLGGCAVRVIMGTAFGRTSPVATHSPTLYLEVRMPRGTQLALPPGAPERAVYVAAGTVEIDGAPHADGVMAVARPGATLNLAAGADSRVLVIGGEPLGARHIWWNFVSSSKERIERAKAEWREDRFPRIPGETERIPLPER